MTDAFVGVDVAFAKQKRLPISVCTWRDGRLVPENLRRLQPKPPRGSGNVAILDTTQVIEFVALAAKYIVDVCEELSLIPCRIAIDAPSKPCKEGTKRRVAEVAMDDAGISCFATPTSTDFEVIFGKVRKHLASQGPENRIPHSNQLWMIVGFRLFDELNRIAPCIEVFPQATARVLGFGQVHKSQKGGVEAQLMEVAKYTGWPMGRIGEPEFASIAFGPAHDRLDAYLSAWVAALKESDRHAFGTSPDDVIWTPRIGVEKYEGSDDLMSRSIAQVPRKRNHVTPENTTRACPACGKHQFKRWPLGWDAHAEHRCTGLQAVGATERKAEFKKMFGPLFPKAGRRLP